SPRAESTPRSQIPAASERSGRAEDEARGRGRQRRPPAPKTETGSLRPLSADLRQLRFWKTRRTGRVVHVHVRLFRHAARFSTAPPSASRLRRLRPGTLAQVYHEGMERVLEALQEAADSGLLPGRSTVLLAVSGGADSMALLYAASELAPHIAWRLAVGHVHHGLRGRDADRDLAFVAAHAKRLELPFLSRRCDAGNVARQLKLSPESAARHARYSALRQMAKEVGAERIATAHQLNDRIESHQIARERRAGIAGLAGPRRRRRDGIVRPLLGVPRAA